jgi:hypothetical protein
MQIDLTLQLSQLKVQLVLMIEFIMDSLLMVNTSIELINDILKIQAVTFQLFIQLSVFL